MGCKCEMPSVRHRSSGSDRNATIAFHFSAVAFVRFVQSISSGSPERSICSGPARSLHACLQRFYRDCVTLETADSPETRWSWDPAPFIQSLTGDAQRWMWPIMYLFVHIFCNRSFAYLNVGFCFLKYTWCISESQNKLFIFIFCVCNWFGWTIHIWPTAFCCYSNQRMSKHLHRHHAVFC